MKLRVLSLLCLVLLAFAGAAAARSYSETLAMSCPPLGHGGDSLSRGFYVTNYPGNNLAGVVLYYSATVKGSYYITLTAHRGSFSGPSIGESQVTSVQLPTTSSEAAVYFNFGGAPVTEGDTIAFTQSATGPGSVFFDYGDASPPCTDMFETNGTTSPLDTVRHDTVGLQLFQQPKTTTCVASDTVLCLDDDPGDQRFAVTLAWDDGGGPSVANEVPLAPFGASSSGVFYFDSPSNPVMLVNILNGCAINNEFWVFGLVDTTSGLTLTLHDTKTGNTFTYSNPDGTALTAIQSLDALPCP